MQLYLEEIFFKDDFVIHKSSCFVFIFTMKEEKCIVIVFEVI